jgi:nicotinamidase-related amidase
VSEALLITDFQNDFTPGGALGVEGGDEIADRVNELAASGRFDLVVASRDWHPPDHSSFQEQGGIWPVHCVQGTEGAELHPSLDRSHVDIVYDKGKDQATDGYSNFETDDLHEILRERGIDKLTVVGLTTDYCVKESVLGARRLGYEVDVDASAIRAVDREPGDGDRAIDEMRAAGADVS